MGQNYNERGKAFKQLSVLALPDRAILDATAPQEIGKGKLLRVKGVAGEFLTFRPDDSNTTAPAAGDKKTIEMEDGFFMIRATDEFVIASVATRIEVIPD